MLKRLDQLLDECFKTVPRDGSGTQHYTEWKVGLPTRSFVLDGGSGVNSTTEEVGLKILNENEAAGIHLSDKRHPSKQLERWDHSESFRGVFGGVSVPMLGSVVVAVNMLELRKHTGPEVRTRFKVCAGGSTNWVGWALGARAIDCLPLDLFMPPPSIPPRKKSDELCQFFICSCFWSGPKSKLIYRRTERHRRI